jgi:hypothetical protein
MEFYVKSMGFDTQRPWLHAAHMRSGVGVDRGSTLRVVAMLSSSLVLSSSRDARFAPEPCLDQSAYPRFRVASLAGQSHLGRPICSRISSTRAAVAQPFPLLSPYRTAARISPRLQRRHGVASSSAALPTCIYTTNFTHCVAHTQRRNSTIHFVFWTSRLSWTSRIARTLPLDLTVALCISRSRTSRTESNRGSTAIPHILYLSRVISLLDLLRISQTSRTTDLLSGGEAISILPGSTPAAGTSSPCRHPSSPCLPASATAVSPPVRTSPARRRCCRCFLPSWSVREWRVMMKRKGGGPGVDSGRSTPSLPERRLDGTHAGGTIPVEIRVGEDARRWCP